MGQLFHITEQTSWLSAQRNGVYRAPSLNTEGFIHLSEAHQVVQTANRFYQGKTGLVLLEINPNKLKAKLQFDQVLDHGTFPHLYGELNLDAVEAERVLDVSDEGIFTGWH